MSKNPEYGTVQYYADCFSDIIGDIGDIDLDAEQLESTPSAIASDYEKADKIMKGFELAINSWLMYHQNAAQNFQHLQDKFLYLRDSPYNYWSLPREWWNR